jgi:hypothetical protein
MSVQNPEAFPGSRVFVESIELEVAANVKCIQGDMAVTDGGRYAEPGRTDTSLTMLGRFNRTVDNTAGLAGAKKVQIRLLNGFFASGFVNDAAAPLTAAHLWTTVYLKDARTASADGTGRSELGTLVRIDSDFVYIKLAGGV